MKTHKGFTLIEIMTVLFILSLLAFMSYRGLSTVLDTRNQVAMEVKKWQQLSAFFLRFEQDLLLAAPWPGRPSSGHAAAWQGRKGESDEIPLLEFSRFASSGDVDLPRRVAYTLNAQQEIELWLWPGMDNVSSTQPARYTVLKSVSQFKLEYLNDEKIWRDSWPGELNSPAIPRALKLHIVLLSGEKISRLFSLKS